MKLLSDDTLNTNLSSSKTFFKFSSENNYTEQKNQYINNSIFHHNKSINNKIKSEIPAMSLTNNIYYNYNKYIFPNNNNVNTTEKNSQNLKKNYEKNVFPIFETSKTLIKTYFLIKNNKKHHRKIKFFLLKSYNKNM